MGQDFKAGLAAILERVEQAGGNLDPAMRAAYVSLAERTVAQELSKAGNSAALSYLTEVDADPMLRDAMFAEFDPPDPSILENYARLRDELGWEFVAKYRSLVIADAVAERTNGAKERPDSDLGVRFPPPGASAPEPMLAEIISYVRMCSALGQGTTDAPGVGIADKVMEESNGAKPRPEADRLVREIANYMDETKTTALKIFQDQIVRAKLAAYLKAHDVDDDQIAKINDQGALHDLLKSALVWLGERPPERDEAPDAATWLRYLAAIYETKQSSPAAPWPRFPMDSAPWPLLMPLHHAYPIWEAVYIWEKYQGLHGSERYHEYGPYTDGADEWRRELQPSAWYWSAWPDLIVHGGICTIMAPISVETHVALCAPAMMAGQPGHSNLMSYQFDQGYFHTVIEQGFAGGPKKTWGSWLFNEIGEAPGLDEQNGRAWSHSDYQIGLALAMESGLTHVWPTKEYSRAEQDMAMAQGLASYTDTRLAVNLYNELPKSEQRRVGRTLLMQAIQRNPYNPAPWHLLEAQTESASDGIDLIQLAVGDSIVTYPKPIADSAHDYWDMMIDNLIPEVLLKEPVPKDAVTAQKIYEVVKTLPQLSDVQKMKYLLAAQGPEGEEKKLQHVIEEHVSTGTKVDSNDARNHFASELQTFVGAADQEDAKTFITHLELMMSSLPGDDPYLKIIESAKPSGA